MPPAKVQFNLEALKQRAFEAINNRISSQMEVISDLGENRPRWLITWRELQEKRVAVLHQKLVSGDITDDELARFRLDTPPSDSQFERRKESGILRDLESERDRIAAKVESLVPDEKGNVSLTPTQLRDFFGL